ncbi:MAG: hypothetical protein QOC55_156, partial [Thermoleophilaceae bacterium]|nr:hypothetical protein [Thermoleophilaceae bacterium]
GDPMLQAWEVAWDAHALRSHPRKLWDANIFFPLGRSLAFSDALVGYSPAGLIGNGVHAAIVRYNVLLIFSFAFAAFGAYALARVLGASIVGAAVAAAAFGFSPWRLAQIGHLNILSSGGIPLSVALLIHGFRRSSPGIILAGWVIAAWQVTLGFSLGLQLLYLLVVLGICFVVTWARRGRPRQPRGVALATVAGGLILVATTLVFARPYQHVFGHFPEVQRKIGEVAFFSPSSAGFASAPSTDLVWGAITAHPRRLENWPEEQTLFPGLIVLVLAGFCLLKGREAFSPRLVRGLALGVLVTGILALGLGPGVDAPYRVVYEIAPGWSGVRTPGRLITLTTLGLALLAAGGVTALRHRFSARVWPAVGIALVVAVLAEGFGRPPLLAPPTHPAVPVAAPVLFLPSDDVVDPLYTLWSIDGFPDVVNGSSGFRPMVTMALRDMASTFPDRASATALKELGVRTVVLDRRLAAPGTVWYELTRHPTAGALKPEFRGPWVVYRLNG